MATSNTALRVSDLDFFSIRNNLKDFLRSQSEFTDYDFEGSGMSVLLDVLSYNTYYNSFYLNMIANEAFLDTAQVRQNILSHAKVINYVPASKQGAITKVNVVVTPEGSEGSTSYVVLDKYTKLLGKDKNGVNYPFVTVNANTASISNGSFSFSNVVIKQGEVITHQFLMSANNTLRKFAIPSQNVDTSTIAVTVQESSSNSYTREFTPATDITLVTGDSLVYYTEEDQDLNYSIYFGDGVIGYAPKNGNIVTVTYLDSIGAMSNSISKFTFTEKVGGLYSNNVKVTSLSATYGGVDKETPEQIRFRAPNFYTAQNRCVTVDDYEALITKDYQNIDAVSVWGGEDNDPVVFGKVYLSLKTKGFYSLSNLEKENIKNELIRNRNVLTVTPEIVDPDYIFLQVRGKVAFNPTLTSKNSTQILETVKNAILSYNTNELNTFRSTFRKSKLQYYIDNCDPGVTGSDIQIYLQKRLPIVTGTTKYQIKFNAPLKKGDAIEKLYSYPQVGINDVTNVTRNLFIEEVPGSYTGISSVEIISGGINYDVAPTIRIVGDGTGAAAIATVSKGKIVNITVTNRGTGYTTGTVVIEGNGTEAYAIAKLQVKYGLLRSFYYKSTGEKIIVNSSMGTIDYTTGLVELNPLPVVTVVNNDVFAANILTINVPPESEIIRPLRNRIISIDPDNSQSILLDIVTES